METTLWPLVVIFFSVLVWLYPLYLVGRSDKTSGVLKLMWIVLAIFISWIAYGMYVITFWRKES